MASILSGISSQYNELWKAIIRPPRDKYSIRDLGPMKFAIGKSVYKRSDFTLRNRRQQVLHCSHFEPVDEERFSDSLPCVIYLHGNCSSRREALPYVPLLLPIGVTLMAVDLSGSGISDGEYISLGYHEKDDLSVLIEYLRKSKRCSSVGIWGRSMGAATALMYSGVEKGDGFLKGVVIDSSFCSLRQLCHELVHHYVPLLPNFLVDSALALLRKTISEKAKVNIDDIAPLNSVSNGRVPALFISGMSDTLVNPSHSKTLHDNYGGEKMLMIIPGNHNSERPKFVKASIVIFFYTVFKCFNSKKSSISLQTFINTDLNLIFNSGIFEDENISKKPFKHTFYAIQQYIRYNVASTNNNIVNTNLLSQSKDEEDFDELLGSKQTMEDTVDKKSNSTYVSNNTGNGIAMRPPDVDKYIDKMIPLTHECSKNSVSSSSSIYSSEASYSRSTTLETLNSQNMEGGINLSKLSSFEEFSGVGNGFIQNHNVSDYRIDGRPGIVGNKSHQQNYFYYQQHGVNVLPSKGGNVGGAYPININKNRVSTLSKRKE
ncbi:protein with a conserved N-terminal region [Cryptosporidium ryanae]|uniref:protein with a conserved N-terminal region n=1 Tax=Cryptosporidium ryanae TaxID=515981 RepID=UPI00351A4B09|nr:protein with a conserved N-terminal region [Cryptosporidium ryanae]